VLAQCHAADPSAAWLSLGPADNDPVVLWWSLIASLRTTIDDFGRDYRNRLLVAGSSVLDDVVSSVTNELAEHQLPVHLFLDDLHLVENSTCTQSLHHFVRSLPDGVRVTVASRDSAPLSLARLRVEGDLIEIAAAELAFSADMAHQMLRGARRNDRQRAVGTPCGPDGGMACRTPVGRHGPCPGGRRE
jgi:LuxR family maltose regulon positive regulatory protein